MLLPGLMCNQVVTGAAQTLCSLARLSPSAGQRLAALMTMYIGLLKQKQPLLESPSTTAAEQQTNIAHTCRCDQAFPVLLACLLALLHLPSNRFGQSREPKTECKMYSHAFCNLPPCRPGLKVRRHANDSLNVLRTPLLHAPLLAGSLFTKHSIDRLSMPLLQDSSSFWGS